MNVIRGKVEFLVFPCNGLEEEPLISDLNDIEQYVSW